MPLSNRAKALIGFLGVALASSATGIALSGSDLPRPPDRERARSDPRVDQEERKPAESRREVKARTPAVPRLIGMTPDEVRETLDPLGLPTEFSHCEGRPPLGHVIGQDPKPGHHLSRYFEEVRISTDHSEVCSDRTVKRPCAPKDLRLRADSGPGYSGATAGKFSLTFGVKNTGVRTCQLRGTAVMTLSNPDWPGDYVRGNPRMTTFDYRLDAGENVGGGGLWQNWCRRHDRWRVMVELLGLQAETDTGAPNCRNRDVASILY